MSKTWVTHFPHFLDEVGNIPKDLPKPAYRLAKALGSFICYATNFESNHHDKPQCFVTIKKKRCQGKVAPAVLLDDNITWDCKECDHMGIISGWQRTLWDLSGDDTVQ